MPAGCDEAQSPCSPHADIPGLQHFKRHERGVHQVPQFMGKAPKALAPACGLSINARLISLTAVLRHRACDGIIEASVQRPKIVGADGNVQFHRQFGDGLADVAIVVHDLPHREPLMQEVMAVLDRAVADLRARNQAET
jgi:hypothetical protein